MSAEEAEVIALKALAFLAADAARLNRFLALSGVDLDGLRAAASSPEFLAGLLNHLLEDESLLLTFTAEQEIDPRIPALAAQMLASA
jgi:Protein of unknown function (DUF3572)